MTRTLIRAGILTGIVDGLWAVALTLFYGRSIAKLWQGVASVPFGPGMMNAGATGVALGLTTHFCVAFAWSLVLLLLLPRVERLRRELQLRPLLLGAIYGPLIWVVMSLLLIPLFTRQAPVVTWRWWVQLAGHAVFVGQPLVWSVRQPK
jgi:hypothetical protein